jgi:hypothetical protein
MGTLWSERRAFVLPDWDRLGQRTIPLQAIEERDGTVREILETTRIAASGAARINTKDKFGLTRHPFSWN